MRKYALAALTVAFAVSLAWLAPLLAATLTVTNTAETGVAMTLSSAAIGGDTFPMDDSGRTFLVVTNGGAGSITCYITPLVASVSIPGRGTFTKPQACGSVTNGTTKIFGPLNAQDYANNGSVSVAYSGVSSVTVGVFKLPQP